MTHDYPRRYAVLASTYVLIAVIVIAIVAVIFGPLALILSTLSAALCSVMAVAFLHDTFAALAREHWQQDVGTWGKVPSIALLGLILAPLLVAFNSWVFVVLFPSGGATATGALTGAVLAGAVAALAARYGISSWALRAEPGSPG